MQSKCAAMAATAEAGSISIRRLAALGMAAVRVLDRWGQSAARKHAVDDWQHLYGVEMLKCLDAGDAQRICPLQAASCFTS